MRHVVSKPGKGRRRRGRVPQHRRTELTEEEPTQPELPLELSVVAGGFLALVRSGYHFVHTYLDYYNAFRWASSRSM